MTGAIRKWTGIALAGCAAAALLYLAVPRSIAAFVALPGDAVMDRVRAGEAVDSENARRLALSRHAALAWSSAPRAWSELSFAEMSLAHERRTPDGRPDPALLESALRTSERALRGSPTDSEAWLRLAYMRLIAEGPNAQAGQALSFAFMTGRVRTKQIPYRLDIAFRLWPVLTADDRRVVMQFIRNSWTSGHDQIMAAANSPARIGIVRAAFAAEPGHLATFEALLQRRERRAP